MAAPGRERPGGVARAGRVDPRLLRALGWSLAAHVGVVFVAILWSLFGPAPTMFEAPPGGPVVDLVAPRGDSRVFKVGPLAKAGGIKGAAAPKEPPKVTPPKPDPPKAAPPKPDPPKAAPPKPDPPKAAPPKPDPPKVTPPKPDPPKAAPPKPDPPKAAPPKPDPPKVTPPKPDPPKVEQPKKPEPTKEEPKTPEPKEVPRATAPTSEAPKVAPVAPDASEPKPVGSPDAGSTKAGVDSTGGGTATDGGPSGDPNGGGGGQGNRSPEFYAYFGYMYRTIKEQWVWAGEQDASLAATIRFSILPDGSIAEARITERSRTPLYDDSALKAVRATGRLMPPPVSVRADFADIELVFQAGDLMEP